MWCGPRFSMFYLLVFLPLVAKATPSFMLNLCRFLGLFFQYFQKYNTSDSAWGKDFIPWVCWLSRSSMSFTNLSQYNLRMSPIAICRAVPLSSGVAISAAVAFLRSMHFPSGLHQLSCWFQFFPPWALLCCSWVGGEIIWKNHHWYL